MTLPAITHRTVGRGRLAERRLALGLAAERAVWTAPHREVLIPWTPRSAFLAMAHAALVALGLALS